jgi:hypothetical protein
VTRVYWFSSGVVVYSFGPRPLGAPQIAWTMTQVPRLIDLEVDVVLGLGHEHAPGG